ncbi:MAG TPA: hypothetical protein DCF44_07565 [Chitinophagaceae bacterium]|nr:hypothetical protein [Chitinophagaceae bacterium]
MKNFFEITLKCVVARNDVDFERMYPLMHKRIIYESPLVSPLIPEYPDNQIEGRDKLNEYFKKVIMRKPAIV